jgi:hypothetical protein
MATSFINDPEHWRNRAVEARTLADQMSDEASKQTMLKIAADYERLAERATLRAQGASPSHQRALHQRAEYNDSGVMTPNFVLLDAALPDSARLLIAMVQARDAVESRCWSHPQQSMLELDLRCLLIANHTVPASRHADPR